MILEEHKKTCANAEVRTDAYMERAVPRMSDSSFHQHFRLSRAMAQRLVELLRTCPEIPVPKKEVVLVLNLSNSC